MSTERLVRFHNLPFPVMSEFNFWVACFGLILWRRVSPGTCSTDETAGVLQILANELGVDVRPLAQSAVAACASGDIF